MTLKQAATLIGILPTSLRGLILRGVVPARKVAMRIRCGRPPNGHPSSPRTLVTCWSVERRDAERYRDRLRGRGKPRTNEALRKPQ